MKLIIISLIALILFSIVVPDRILSISTSYANIFYSNTLSPNLNIKNKEIIEVYLQWQRNGVVDDPLIYDS